MTWWGAGLAAGLLLLGCGDDDAGTVSDAGQDAAEPEDVFVPGDAGPTATWEVDVRDLLTGDPVTTARICVHRVPELPCASVNMDGVAMLEVPVNIDLQLHTTATRYMDQLNTFTSDGEPRRVRLDIAKTSNIVPLLSAAGVTLDREKGQLAFLAQSGPGDGLADVTATLDPAGGEGPFFTRDSIPDAELTATTSDGLGVYANVDPGELEVVYANPAGDCTADEGWDRGANRVGTRLEANTLTIIIARCEAPPEMDAGPPMMDGGAMDGGVPDGG